MNKNRRKPKRINKFATAIISIIAAVIIWVGVIYLNPPELSTTVYNLPVRIIGSETLNKKSLAVIEKNRINGLSVTISGKRNDLIRLSGNIYAEVDVSSIDKAGKYELSGDVSLPSQKITIKKVNFETIPITVDSISSKEVAVEVRQIGSADNMLVRTTPSYDKITLKGAKSELAQVDKAVIEADISDITEDTELENGYILANSKGSEVIQNETMTSDINRITVAYEVYEKITLPIKPRLSKELSQGYTFDASKTFVSPNTAEVGIRSGAKKPSEVYAEINENLNETDCLLYEEEGMYIPNSVKTVRAETVVTKKQGGRAVRVTATNLGTGLVANVSDMIIAPDENMSEETIKNSFISAYADLSGYGEGKHSVTVTVYADGITVPEQYYTTAKITRKGK